MGKKTNYKRAESFFRHTTRHRSYRQLELLFQWGTYPHVLGHSLIPVKKNGKQSRLVAKICSATLE